MGEPITVEELQEAVRGSETRAVVQLLGLGSVVLVGRGTEPQSGWTFRTGESRPVLPPTATGLGLLNDMKVWPLTPRKPRPRKASQQVLVGRSRSNDVVLDHNGVSKLHARLEVSDSTTTLEDAGSRNGTSVNGRPVKAGTLVALHNGDVVIFGGIALTLYATPSLITLLRARIVG